jgi:hypothetical protein
MGAVVGSAGGDRPDAKVSIERNGSFGHGPSDAPVDVLHELAHAQLVDQPVGLGDVTRR